MIREAGRGVIAVETPEGTNTAGRLREFLDNASADPHAPSCANDVWRKRHRPEPGTCSCGLDALLAEAPSPPGEMYTPTWIAGDRERVRRETATNLDVERLALALATAQGVADPVGSADAWTGFARKIAHAYAALSR